MLEADPKAEGVIGSRVLPKGWVARKPSDIYWNGIRTFGIFCDYGLSIPEYVSLAVKLKEQKSVSRLGNRNDDAEEMIRMIRMQETSAILDSGIFRFIMMIGETTLQ